MKSEYASLSDLVMTKGISHSELIQLVHQEILAVYKESYPKAPIDSSIVVDETTGEVRVFSQGEEVTPPDFKAHAESIARQVLIDLLHQNSSQQSDKQSSLHPILSKKVNFGGPILQLLFWGYNALFLLLILMLGASAIKSIFEQSLIDKIKELGAVQLTFITLLALTPVATVFYALTHKLYSKTGQLTRLFFLVETPIMLILYTSLSLGVYIHSIFFFVIILLLIPLVFINPDQSFKDLSASTLVTFHSIHQILILAVSYITLLFSFYSPIVLGKSAQLIYSTFTHSFNRPRYGNIL